MYSMTHEGILDAQGRTVLSFRDGAELGVEYAWEILNILNGRPSRDFIGRGKYPHIKYWSRHVFKLERETTDTINLYVTLKQRYLWYNYSIKTNCNVNPILNILINIFENEGFEIMGALKDSISFDTRGDSKLLIIDGHVFEFEHTRYLASDLQKVKNTLLKHNIPFKSIGEYSWWYVGEGYVFVYDPDGQLVLELLQERNLKQTKKYAEEICACLNNKPCTIHQHYPKVEAGNLGKVKMIPRVGWNMIDPLRMELRKRFLKVNYNIDVQSCNHVNLSEMCYALTSEEGLGLPYRTPPIPKSDAVRVVLDNGVYIFNRPRHLKKLEPAPDEVNITISLDRQPVNFIDVAFRLAAEEESRHILSELECSPGLKVHAAFKANGKWYVAVTLDGDDTPQVYERKD